MNTAEFFESFVIPVLIILLVIGIALLIYVNNTNNSIDMSDYFKQSITVYRGCTVYDLWKEYGGYASWDEYSYEVQKLNSHSIGNLAVGEEIVILVYMGEIEE